MLHHGFSSLYKSHSLRLLALRITSCRLPSRMRFLTTPTRSGSRRPLFGSHVRKSPITGLGNRRSEDPPPCPGSSDNILPATAVRNSSTPRCSRFSPTSSPSQFSRTLWPGSYWQRGSVDAVIVMAALVRLIAFAPSLKLLESRHFWALTVLQRGSRMRRGQYMVTVSQNMERPAPEEDHSSPEQ